jgi:hypothetical protein
MGVECQSGILPNMQSIADNRSEFIVIAAGAVWFELWQPVSTVSVIAVIGLLVGGWPILKQAFENLLARRMTMGLSMTIAIVAAAVIGEFFPALVITPRPRSRGAGRHDGLARTTCDPRPRALSLSAANGLRPSAWACAKAARIKATRPNT